MKSNISLPRLNRGLRNFTSTQKRREFLQKKLNIKLENIGRFNFTEEQVANRNIENLIGTTQIPLGIAGPLRVKGQALRVKEYFIPLATTEGALVASISRGCKAITESGGALVEVEDVGITRGPVFRVKNLKQGIYAKKWIENNFQSLSEFTHKTSPYLKLLKTTVALSGKSLFCRFQYHTTDAMGMNMATFATEEALKLIEEKTQVECIALAGNFDIDKKPAWLNFIEGRGKKVWAETVLSKKITRDVLKTSPQKIAEVVFRKNHIGSEMAGSLGFNAHFANIIAAIFIATGQDPAHVVEGSLGITTAEVLDSGNLYFSIYLPSLVVGIVGGGTHLPTQQEALKIMKVSSVLEYAQAVGAAVLAGELSLIASLAEGTLSQAHKRLGRKERSHK